MYLLDKFLTADLARSLNISTAQKRRAETFPCLATKMGGDQVRKTPKVCRYANMQLLSWAIDGYVEKS